VAKGKRRPMSDFWHGKRVAVLGGAGMIGSQLVALLVEAGAEVAVADDLSRGRMSNLNSIDCEFDYADLTDMHNLRSIRAKDAVFNLAARVTGMHYNRLHHGEMFYENMLLQTVPLKACIMWNVPLYLQCSTVCVYPRDMGFPVTEEEGHRGEPEPTNLGYGLAKRLGERYAQWVHQETGMGIGITRFSNCFGPRDYFDPKTSHVIPALIKRTFEDDVVKVYGTGNQLREFLYAEDAAIGAMKVLEHYAVADPVNIGNPNNRITIRGLANLIQDLVFGPGIYKPLYFDTSIEDGYPRRGSAIEKLIKVTGWQPQTSLFDGLRETISWYQKNKDLAERSKF
jgi:nucleoside-diphosphate-sugar epimerase